MRTFARPALVTLFALALSACGHGSSSTIPGVPPQNTSGGRPTSSNTVSTAQNSTLYVSSAKSVYAFPLAAQGTQTASQTIAPHTDQQARIVGLAAAADGNLGILQEYYPDTNSHRCRVVIHQAGASQAAAADIDCGEYSNAYAYGITRNPRPTGSATVPQGDAFDVLTTIDSTSQAYVKRMDEAGRTLSTLTLPANTFRSITTDLGGHDYVADPTTNHVKRYDPTSADGGSTTPTADLAISNTAGQVAVSPVNKTLWVATNDGTNTVINGYAFPGANQPYSSTPSQTINTNLTKFTVGALAFDQAGHLYAGLNLIYGVAGPSKNVVRVFDVSTQTPTVLHSLAQPVPGNPSDITGLAISEGPFANQPDPQPAGFQGPITFNNYSNGPVRGQNGWLSNSCGNSDYDANVVNSSSYPNATWNGTPPTKALQVDNAVTQGCYSGLGTPLNPQTAGIPSSVTDPSNWLHCGNTCQPFFATQFVVTSATGTFQPALEMSISPVWNNDGARMHYVGLWHTQDANSQNKLLIFTNDVEDVLGASPPCLQCANFVAWELAYVDPALPHTVGMTIEFVAPNQDVTKFYVDGSLAGVSQQTFRSWEDYYLYDTESDPGYTHPNSRAVNDLLLHPGNVDSCLNFQDYSNNCNQRNSGPDHTSTANNGFLFTNIATCSGTSSSCASTVQGSGGNLSRTAATARRSSSMLRSASLPPRTLKDLR